jgi:hypothetical protein
MSSRCAQERHRQLASGPDLELAVGVAQVHLDRLRRHVEHFRDAAVRLPVRGEVDDAPLARGQRAETRLSLVEGTEPLRDGIVAAELLSLRRHDEHLFLRYDIAAAEAVAAAPARR